MCCVILRLLINMYTRQLLQVKWCNSLSACFNATNGVKQGGVLSPVLFTVYVDQLYSRLAKSGSGCYIGHQFMGAFGYADDIVILAPTIRSLKNLLKICDEFGTEFEVLFNPDKYQFLHYCNDEDSKIKGLTHNNVYIPTVNHAIHLGKIVGPSSEGLVIQEGTKSFTKFFNGIAYSFPKAVSKVKYTLFKTYCMSLYNCVLWDFNKNEFNKFQVQWRKSIRKLLNIPIRTHNNLLSLICGDIDVDLQIYRRFVKFITNINNSKNSCVQLCSKLVNAGSASVLCCNLNKVSYKLKISKDTLLYNKFNINLQYY